MKILVNMLKKLKNKWNNAVNMTEELKNELIHDVEKICCPNHDIKESNPGPLKKREYFLGICILAAAIIVGSAWVYSSYVGSHSMESKDLTKIEESVLPAKGVKLPVVWGNLGNQLIDLGVIDKNKFESLYAQRGGLDDNAMKLLTGNSKEQLVITKNNSGVILNLLWALGLANKNLILETGPMVDKQYGGNAGNFASTGGWTLSVGNSMNHYSQHAILPLTAEQQRLVEEVSKNIYRPCCGNSTYFPDCNHGMAMFGFLELMASQGVNEENMYKAALAVNSFWFPDTYINIAQFIQSKGLEWGEVSPKEILGQQYSSAQGYQQVYNQIVPVERKSNNSCGA